MSDNQNDLDTTNDAEFDVEEVVVEEPKPRSKNGVAWLAVLLSFIALGAGGYSLYANWQSQRDKVTVPDLAAVEALQARVDELGAALTSLNQAVTNIEHPDVSADFDSVRQEIDEQLSRLNSLPPRMSSLENSVASLAGISAGARETFLLAEGEYYLQIANAQLQLANNPHLATLALGMADERITQISDPGLTDVRRAISDELAALETMQRPDIEGATLTLASLARVVESLPIASGNDEDDAATDPDAAEASTADRAWGSVKDAVSGLVKVTPPDQAKLALVSPDAEYFLRNNIALQLQSARLALLRGEQSIFEQTLDDTNALLGTYFDASSPQVQSAQETIAEIRGSDLAIAIPDISESLRLLRQYRLLRENSE